MGLNIDGVAFLLDARERGVSFTRTLMLGRQEMHMTKEQLIAACRRSRAAIDPSAVLATGWAEPFFEALGAEEILSLDASEFEGAAIVHDLNDPVPQHLHGRFTAVVDGGTIEHVFNVPVALSSVANLLETGGHALHINPGNNHLGHGFYQFSPELYWRALPALGFEVLRVLLKEDGRGSWYEVADPAELGRRVVLGRGHPALLYVLARKVTEAHGAVVQSDYAAVWRTRPAGESGDAKTGATSRLARAYARSVPLQLRSAIWRLRSRRARRDAEAFKRVEPPGIRGNTR